MSIKRTFLVVAAAVSLAAAGVYSIIRTPWFSQTFSGLTDGAAFDGTKGAAGGEWGEIPLGAATVDTVGGRKCISINTDRIEQDSIQFNASNALARTVSIDFAISTGPLRKPPTLGKEDFGALCLLSTNQVGVREFGGYAKDGWNKLYGRGLAEHRQEWLDCRAKFEYETNNLGQVTSAHVTYYAKNANSEYMQLVDTNGVSRFEVATNVVSAIAFSGVGYVGDFSGSGLEETAASVCVWNGSAGDNRWENPKNWDGGKAPDDGDVAQVSDGKIVYGKYTIEPQSASKFSIVSNECLKIVSGNIGISCDDRDYTSLGTVYVDAGTTLQACGTYAGIEMAFGSTLVLSASVGLTVTDKRFFLDGVTLDVTEMLVDKSKLEGVWAITAPYGSGGVPAKLWRWGAVISGWTVDWHDRLDGGADLWLVNATYSGDVATWNDGASGPLVYAPNWDREPGAEIAARIGNGRPHVSADDVFWFARWLDIGHAGTGEVGMSDGTVRGNADAGGAIVVGSDGGTGLLDIVDGLVRPYDYLWNYALTLGTGTNSTGTVRVRGGTVDAAGGSVSVGSDGAASMKIEDGRVSAGGELGVGCSGTLDMSGGILAVSNSIYVGRSARDGSYDVRMTVSDGVVSNLAAGAIWIGSYGGIGSKAALTLTGGEVYATNKFVCGGYRSATVDVDGGTLVAPEIRIGHDLTEADDVASFNLLSGRVETAGFTSGTNGIRNLALAGGELVATAANDDFFAGLDVVRLEGDTVLENADDIVVKSALAGPGDFVKAGVGTNTVVGPAAWAGRTIVAEGVLDMDGGMVTGELQVEAGASVVRAKYDEIDALLAFLPAETWNDWTSGTASDSPYVYVDFSNKVDGVTTAVAKDDDGVIKGAFGSAADDAGAWAFRGWTALGWMELRFQDGSAVEAGVVYDVRMMFDFRTVGTCAKPYVVYYVKRGDAYERLANADGLSAFPAAGESMSITTFEGVPMTAGKQLDIASVSAFYWVGPDGGEWNDGRNWSAQPDGEGGIESAYPEEGSLAFVEKSVLITLPQAAKTALLYVNANVRFSGEKALSVSDAVSGVGTLTLSNATMQAAGLDVLVTVPVVAESGTANCFLSTPSSCNFVLGGPLRGTGEIALTALNRRPMRGTILAGDNAEFGGLLKIYPYYLSAKDHQQLDMPSIAVPEASSANAQWEINVEYDYPKVMKPGVDFFGTPNATYRFGALKANFYCADAYNAYWAQEGVTLEVGALDLDSYAVGTCTGKCGVIDWVAPTATFVNEVTGLSELMLSGGGRMVVADEAALPSDAITFADRGGEFFCDVNVDLSVLVTNSTAPVVFNDGGTPCEWSGAPGDSNVGGFVKRGLGTLVWYAAPTFRIDVTVEEGTLIVPFGTQLGKVTVASGAALVVDCGTNAVENALVFSADSTNVRRIKEPYLQFWNVPEGYEIDVTYGNNNSIVASNGSETYDWTGAGADPCWHTLDNWLVGDLVPQRPPESRDIVRYGSGCVTTRLDSAASALTVDGSCDIVLTGSKTLEALLRFKMTGFLDLCPNPMSADELSADYYGAGTNVLGVSSIAELSVITVRGEGVVSADDSDLVVSPSGVATNRFVGTLCAGNFIKNGSGTFEFIGDGAFSGSVAVQQGTLRIGSYRDIDGIRMDFDASDDDSIELDDNGNVVNWTSLVGAHTFGYANGQYAKLTTDWFGGRNAVMLRPDESASPAYSRYDLSPANASGNVSKSLFMVYVPTGLVSGCYGYAQLNGANRSLQVDGDHWICPETGFGTNGIFTAVSYGSAAISNGVPSLTFWSDTALQDDAGIEESLGTAGTGTGFRGAIGEVVSFSRTLSHIERDVTSRLLMYKWSVPGCTEFAPIHADTPVTMCAGATLDLGGQTVRVGSFTGAGVITNGVLETADGKITQSGGTLSVPAYEGMTYVASNAGEKLIIRDAPGVNITIVIPKGWFAAGNTGRRVIRCDSDTPYITWKIWNDKVRPVKESDGWWSLSGGGFAIRLK